ncbi:hypothetical protein ACFPOI_25245 [Nonomuraea angiospora]|uniref:Uncharacterized protein n=1 Tax=Nonomuraea angiospora TaxID=46172 RepID=A0ABR9LPF7_9ACTN|nr:hypothetical protein [Nonomuraea angiospora]MBE1582539.1 hypothetical protein [Nonomuraea angiospora]
MAPTKPAVALSLDQAEHDAAQYRLLEWRRGPRPLMSGDVKEQKDRHASPPSQNTLFRDVVSDFHLPRVIGTRVKLVGEAESPTVRSRLAA